MGNKLDLQKKQHRERGQLAHRKRLGLLEKHKDYVLRAKDYHLKQERLKKLAVKAASRNKDEFYFGMINSKTKKGVHIASRSSSTSLPMDLVKILKSQDAGYVRVLVATEEKKIARLKQEIESNLQHQEESSSMSNILEFASESAKRKRILFAETEQEVKSLSKRARKSLSESSHKPSPTVKKDLENDDDDDDDGEEDSTSQDLDTLTFSSPSAELTARVARLTSLKRALREMDMQAALMGRGSRKEIVKSPKQIQEQDKRRKSGRFDEEDEEGEIIFGENGRERKVQKEWEKGLATGSRIWKWKSVRRK